MRLLSKLLFLIFFMMPCNAAVNFDGVDDYIKIKPLSLTASSNFTISTWIKLNSTPSPFATFVSLEESMGYLRIDANSSNQVFAYIYTGVQNYIGTTTINLNQWYNLVYTRNGANFSFYVDGVLRETRILANPFPGAGLEAIGARNLSGSNYFLDGSINDIKIYNRFLTASEIFALYNSRSKRPTGSLANGLIAHYEMDDDAIGEIAAQVKDSSGNDNHGEFIGFENIAKSYKNDSAKGSGKSIEFDGNSEYINIGETFDGYSSLTVSLWAKRLGLGVNWGRLFLNTAVNQSITFTEHGISPRGVLWRLVDTTDTYHEIAITTPVLNDNQWVHLVGSWNGNLMKLFANGNLLGSTIFTGTLGLVIPGESGSIGGREDTIASYFNGAIDDVSIYNRDLSDSEIKFLYNGSGTDPGTSNLQALWTFDDDSALKDSSGNDNHGLGRGGNSLRFIEGILKR